MASRLEIGPGPRARDQVEGLQFQPGLADGGPGSNAGSTVSTGRAVSGAYGPGAGACGDGWGEGEGGW